MGSDGEGGGKEAVVARKGRKRQMVLESSDSEADEYHILTRHKSDAVGAAAAVGTAGTGGRGGGDQAREEVSPVSSEELPRVKSTEGDGSESNKGDELNRSSTKSDPKKARIEAVSAGNGGGVSKAGTSGKMLRPGFPTWRFEKPEVRAGRVDEKDEVEMKASSGSKFNEQVSGSDDRRRRGESLKHENHIPVKTDKGNLADSGRQESVGEMKAKVKEQVSSLDDKRGRVEPLKHNKGMPLTTGKGNLVESGKREVIRVQGKSGVLKILPKNNKVAREISDGKVLPKKTKVDGETGDSKTRPKVAKVVETRDGKIPTKSGVLKLIPKNTNRENSDVKLLPKNIKVDEETENGRIPMKNIKVDGETSDGKILTKTSKMDRQSGDDKVMTKSCKVDVETGAVKIQARNNKLVEETSDVYRQDKEKNSALDESQKQDANGGKRVTGKLVSSIILRRSDPSVVGVSSGEAMKQKNSKAQAQLKISSLGNRQPSPSLKNEKTKLGEHKNEKKRLLEHKGSSENLSKKAKSKVTDLQGTSDSTLKEHVMKKQRGGPRSTAKQKLRDQIKHILLDNGWKIELRPRRSKDYEDSVYVSPQGSGYWSITKAYAVFQEHLKNSHNEKPKGRSSKLINHEPGVANSSSDAISKDDLAILKRNVQKRRNSKEHSAGKKCVDNRSRDLEDTFAGRSFRNKYQNNEERLKIKHQGCSLLVRGSTRNTEGMDDYIPYKWKRTVLSWMIDLGIVSEDVKVKYMNKKGTRARLEGRITREGIYCGCCSKILTVAKFESHSGSKDQQPYANIVLEDGEVSLLQCLLDAWDKQAQYEKKGFYTIDPADDPDDDTCGICGDGGDLLCCDRCTSTFHVACLGIEMPSGDWYCRSCICKFCGTAEERTSSFAELLSCLQCSRKYHQVCAPGTEKNSVCTRPGASIDCFCSPGCRKIYKRLNRLLGSKNAMEAGFSWSLVHCCADSKTAPPKEKAQSVLCNSKTAVAFSVMDECFLPRIDERSGINIIHNVVYNCGSDFNRLDFRGFYTFILERGDEVISAATVRIHGTDLAEMPFIGTRGMYRRQGMCHRLLNAIESALGSLNVRRLVIPAIPELQKAWTTAFGFKPVGPVKKQNIKSFNLLIIHGTGLLEKQLLLTGQVNQETTAGTVNTIGCNKMDALMFDEASGSITPVHASPELAVGGDRENKDHDNSCALNGSVAGLTSDLPPSPGDKTPERTSPFCVDDDNLRTIPEVGKDDMPCNVEADSTEKIKYAETDGTLVADNIVSEQNSRDKTNSSHADSSVIPVTVDPCSLNELGKGENCTSGELSVEVVRVREKTECNLISSAISVHFDTREDKQTRVVCADTKVRLVTMDQKPDKLELKNIVADGDTQSSLEVKGLDVMVNGRSIDAYATKDQTFVCDATNNAVATTEDHHHSAVDLVVVSTERPVQQKDMLVKDKAGSPSSDLKHSSTSETIMLETSNETVSIESKKIEMKDATVEVGITAEISNETGITDSVLDMSNDDCEVIAKPSLTCGEGQLHGEDAIHNNSMEDCLASREPVNA